MRHINRNRLPEPKILSSDRCRAELGSIREFVQLTQARGGTRRAPSSEWLDDDRAFRAEVAAMFRQCCAYCEQRAPHSRDRFSGRIGRHRPQSLAQSRKGESDLLAYVWLTYAWDNILWICSDCERRKGPSFFVRNARGKPFASVRELAATEGALFLDPCHDQPSEHLEFHPDGSVQPLSPEGSETLAILELERPALRESRRAAMLEVLEDLMLPPDSWAGAPRLRSLDPDAVTEQSFAHSGACAAALTAFARARANQGFTGGAPQVIASLQDQPEAERRRFLSQLAKAIDARPDSAAAPPDTLPGSESQPSRRPSRVPRLRDMPDAARPITRVEISAFRALRDIAFDLPEQVEDSAQAPCMLLLGENATGKSSVLEAIALATIGASEASLLNAALRDEDISPAGLIHRPDPAQWSETAPQMRIALHLRDSNTPVVLEAAAGDPAFSGNQRCIRPVLGYGPRRFFSKRAGKRYRAPAERVRSLFDPMAMIANPVDWLATLDEAAYFAAARALREVLMLDHEDDFERVSMPDAMGRTYIRQGGQRVAIKDLSVGYKSVIAMVCDIIRELLHHYDNLEHAAGLVFIDEIETHLHPRWKMQIMHLLRRAFPQVQFIVTTHDPLCLRGMYDGEVFVLERSAETDQIRAVTDLPSIRGMRAEQILTSEFFGLGSTDPETDARLARYNRLAARIETLTELERDEMQRLRKALDGGMVLGTTLREQAYAEALKQQVTEHSTTPTRAISPRRADLRKTFSALFEDGTS